MDMATTNTTPAAAEYHARLQAIDPYSVSLAPGHGGVELIVFLLTVLDLMHPWRGTEGEEWLLNLGKPPHQ